MDTTKTNEPTELFQVLINDEAQYSLWPATKQIPLGWKQTYGPDSKQACLDYVKKEWTDMRPKSLREHMDKDK